MNQVPVRRESVDVIICLDVLCETTVCPKTALQQCYEILRPQGLLILNLPAFESLRGQHDSAVGIRQRFRSGEARSLLERTGFDLLSMTYWNMVLFLPLLAWRMGSRAYGVREPRSDLTRVPRWLDPLLEHASVGRAHPQPLDIAAVRFVDLSRGPKSRLIRGRLRIATRKRPAVDWH